MSLMLTATEASSDKLHEKLERVLPVVVKEARNGKPARRMILLETRGTHDISIQR
jgi:hypothetical protein